MRLVIRLSSLVSVLPLLASLAPGQTIPEAQQISGAQQIADWQAPLLWTPPSARSSEGARMEATSTVPTPLPFIALSPCRVADTRGNGFTGAYGPPALVANATRSFTITGQCGIPVTAAAVSSNFGALNVSGQGSHERFRRSREGHAQFSGRTTQPARPAFDGTASTGIGSPHRGLGWE